MTVRNLDFLFAPKSVALIGASPRPATVGDVVIRNLRAGGFAGPIMLVNPKHRTIDGLPVHPDVASLPTVPDLAIIATPPATVPGLIADLGRRGTKAAIVITAGFGAGTEARRLKQAMLDAARPHLLRIVGPNCLGVLVPGIGLNASFAHLPALKGRLAFLAQSGAVVGSVIDWATARGIGFSHLVSIGEMVDVDFGDLLDYFARDPDTSAILLYVEAVTQVRKFMSAARVAARSKPVIAIKAGRHAEGARAVASHTGAMAGSDAVYDAAFRRAGMLRVFALDELFAAVETLATATVPPGDRLAILTNGGGIGILATDALIDAGGRLAELSAETLRRLDGVLPATWSRGNPIDIVGDAPGTRYAEAMRVVLEDRGIDAVLVLNCPTAITSSLEAARAVVETLGERKCCVLTSWVGEETARQARALFAANGVPSYDTPERAVQALMQMVAYRRSQDMLMQTPASIPEDFAPDRAAARAIVEAAMAAGREMLTGPESQAVVAAYEIAAVGAATAATPAEAAAAAARIGAPVALKILSRDISHKSDVGGVALDLGGAAATEAAARAMLERVRERRPEARVDGFTVEPMIRRPGAHELIVGMVEDEQFGPVILFGQGGVAVEVVEDRALALPPLNMSLARELMSRTRVHRLLQGYRDRPAAALDAIALTLIKVSQLVTDIAEIAELDINPLLADAAGVIALDVRIKLRRPARVGPARLAIRPYPRELEESVEVEGRRLLLRPVRPEDEPAFRRAFAKLSPQAVRMRFFAPLRELSHALGARLTQLDYDREMALVLADPGPAGPAEIYGVARISANPGNERAEYAIIVRDDMTGKGIGRLLMRRIIDYAAGRGIGEIFGDVLAENAPMLDMCRRLGFVIEDGFGEAGVVRVRLRLAQASPR